MSDDEPVRIYARTDKMFEFMRKAFEKNGSTIERVDASDIDIQGTSSFAATNEARFQQSCHQPPFDDAIYARGIFGRSFQLNCPLQ